MAGAGNTMIFTLLGVDRLSPVFKTAGSESAKAGHKIGGSFKNAESGVTRATGRMRQGLSNTFTGLKGLVAPAIGAFTALGAIGFAKSSLKTYQNAGVEVLKLQRVAGGSAESMSRLRAAAILSGIGTETLTKGLAKGSKALVNTEGNAKATAKMVALLGFNYQDAHGKVLPWNVLLPKLADKFKGMHAGPQKTALAMKLFGRSGTDMLPFLNRGSAGIAALAAQSDKLGTTMSGKNLKAIAAYRMQQRLFNLQMEGLKITIGKALLPVMTGLMTIITRFVSQMRSGTGVGGAFVLALRDLYLVVKAVVVPLKDTVKFLWQFKLPIAIMSALIATVFIPHLVAMGVAAVISGAETAAVWLMLKRDAIVAAATHSWAVVRIVAGWVVMGVQSMIQAGRMAVAWVIAMGPIAWVTVAIIALVALIVWKWKTIHDWTVKTFGGMGKAVKNFFVGLPGQIGDLSKALFAKGVQLLNGFRTGVVSVARSTGSWFNTNVVQPTLRPFLKAGAWLIQHGRGVINGLRAGIFAVARSIGSWLIATVVQPILRAFLNAGNWLVQHGRGIINGLRAGIFAVAKSTGGWINTNVIQPHLRAFSRAGTWLVQHGRGIINGLRSGIFAVARSTGSWLDANVVQPTLRTFSRAGTWLVQHGRGVVNGLRSGIVSVAKSTGTWLNTNVVQPHLRAFVRAGTWLVQHGRGIINGLRTGIVSLARSTGSWIYTNVIAPTIRAFSGAGRWLYGWGRAVIGGFWNGLGAMWRNVMKWIGGIGDWIRKNKGPVSLDGRLLIPAGKAIMEGFLNGLKSGAGAAWNFVQKVGGKTVAVLRSALGIGGNTVNIPQGLLRNLGDAQRKYQGSRGVERWRGIALQALKLTGMPASWIGSLLRRMNQESGGNPRAINLTDSNARKGTPSMGLMQTILPTFNAYAGAWRKYGPWNPLANIIASIRYANAQYGAAPRGWNRPGGYKQGGWLLPGKLAYNETSRPEAVFNQAQLAMLGRGIGGGEVHIHLDGAIIASRQQALDWLTSGIDKLKQQRRI